MTPDTDDDVCSFSGCGRPPEVYVEWSDTERRYPNCTRHARNALREHPALASLVDADGEPVDLPDDDQDADGDGDGSAD